MACFSWTNVHTTTSAKSFIRPATKAGVQLYYKAKSDGHPSQTNEKSLDNVHDANDQPNCDPANNCDLGPFLIQSDFSVGNGLFRLKPKSGFLTQSKKGFFGSIFFDGEFRLADPVEKLS